MQSMMCMKSHTILFSFIFQTVASVNNFKVSFITIHKDVRNQDKIQNQGNTVLLL